MHEIMRFKKIKYSLEEYNVICNICRKRERKNHLLDFVFTLQKRERERERERERIIPQVKYDLTRSYSKEYKILGTHFVKHHESDF
jgi:hypothetical protein